MEMIIGCIFLGTLIVLFCIFCKNLQITVNIEYPVPQYMEVQDPYTSEGELKEDQNKTTIDDILKEVNKVMLGVEEESNE